MNAKKIQMGEGTPLQRLALQIRFLAQEGSYEKGKQLTAEAMKEFPDSAEPHNLLGILLEKTGEHSLAMKHFRAAYALDPTYAPARKNLEVFGTFGNHFEVSYGTEEGETAEDPRIRLMETDTRFH